MPIVWDANIVSTWNIGNNENMMVYKFAHEEYHITNNNISFNHNQNMNHTW